MTSARVREPLYQRIERLVRSRRSHATMLWALGVAIVAVPVVLMAWQGVALGSPFVLGFAAYIVLVVGGGVLLMGILQRRRGRAFRKEKAVLLPSRTRWRALDQALANYGVRTDAVPLQAAYTRRATMGESVDAELVYAGDGAPGVTAR
jgi:hypothetical protein